MVTDVHGWIAGQHARHEPQLNLDFGDLVSLYERLQECMIDLEEEKQGDWFLLFNGDFMDGTGLSTVPPEYLAPLLQQVPFSALNVGNHELYFNEVVDYMMKPASEDGFIASWGGKYLATNVDHISYDSRTNTTIHQPFGSRYTYLHGRNRNTTILTFGFLYNFLGNSNHTRVRNVEDVLQEPWFGNVLTDFNNYDAILVLAHMDAVDPLVFTILEIIRSHVGASMPIQFLTGHTHRRHYEVLDPMATSLEAGRFMDTVGYVSFPTQKTVEASRMGEKEDGAHSLIQHRFLNANKDEIATTVLQGSPGDDFSTLNGRALTAKMQQTQQMLGLLDVVTACAPGVYVLEKPIDDKSSLWWLYLNEVIPKTLFPRLAAEESFSKTSIPIFLQGTGALRYDLMGPTIVVDDIIAITPFANPIYQVGHRLTAQALLTIFDELKADELSSDWELAGLVNFGVAGGRPSVNKSDDDTSLYDLYTVQFHLKRLSGLIRQVQEVEYAPKPLFATKSHGKLQSSTPLDTTNLWMDFIDNEWKCPQHHSDASKPHLRTSWLGMAINTSREFDASGFVTLSGFILLFVVLVAFTLIRRRRRPFLPPTRDKSSCIGEGTPLLSH